jgi:hypothetical protein
MPVEIGLWRIDGGRSVRLASSAMSLESRLETMIESDPTILGDSLLLIGRQVPTGFGLVDLLGIDAEGTLHVIELKRDRTPRDVVAQVLDYGSWVSALSHDHILELFARYRPAKAFEEMFAERFGDAPPEQLNAARRLTIVASEVDAATERIVTYLANEFSVPVNVVFFRHYADDGREYLARTWLIDEAVTSIRPSTAVRGNTQEQWNGRDWYVSFGEYPNGRNWDDGRKYGFVAAGGGAWFSRTLRALPIDARIFVCMPKAGYVGVGTAVGDAQRFDEATVIVNGNQ